MCSVEISKYIKQLCNDFDKQEDRCWWKGKMKKMACLLLESTPKFVEETNVNKTIIYSKIRLSSKKMRLCYVKKNHFMGIIILR